MTNHIYWVAEDGSDWGRSTVDRHGRSRVAPPDDARIVPEEQYREHLREIRVLRDRQEQEADAAWRAEPLVPNLVVAPAGAPALRQLEIANAYLQQATDRLAELNTIVDTYTSQEQVSVSGRVTTDASTFAEIVYELGVEPLPPAITAIAGSIVHDIATALDQGHKSVVPARSADGTMIRRPFPIPTNDPPGSGEWASFVAQHTNDVSGASELIDKIYGDVETDDWKRHPIRRLRALYSVEQHQAIARVSAVAEVRGEGLTRIHGLGIGDDFTLPNRTDGTQHTVRFALDSDNREEHIDKLRDLITRCEALDDNDISFAMYSKQEELTELQRELDSWYPPFEVGVEVNSAVQVMAAGARDVDLVTELGNMIDFVSAALGRYQAFVDTD